MNAPHQLPRRVRIPREQRRRRVVRVRLEPQQRRRLRARVQQPPQRVAVPLWPAVRGGVDDASRVRALDVSEGNCPYERTSGWSSKASGEVERRRGRGLKARGGRRDAPGKVLKDRRSQRRRGRMGTGVNKYERASSSSRAWTRRGGSARRERRRRRPGAAPCARPSRRGARAARDGPRPRGPTRLGQRGSAGGSRVRAKRRRGGVERRRWRSRKAS